MRTTIPSIEYLRGAIDAIINNFEINNGKFDQELGLGFDIENVYDNDLPFTESTVIGYKIRFFYVVEEKEIGNDETGPQSESKTTEDWFKVGLDERLTKVQSCVEDVLERVSQVKLAA